MKTLRRRMPRESESEVKEAVVRVRGIVVKGVPGEGA